MEITTPRNMPPAGTPESRALAYAFEAQLRALPPADMPVTEYFSHGVYARELFIPAGTALTGKVHKFDNLNILLEGEIAVMTADGTVKRLGPGFVEVAPPGMKRVAVAITDTRWMTVHGTHERDVAKIEAEFVAQDEQEYLAHARQLLQEN